MQKPQPVFPQAVRWRAVCRSYAQKNYCHQDGKKLLLDSRKYALSKGQILGQSNTEWFKIH
jgi:hypothetical protein